MIERMRVARSPAIDPLVLHFLLTIGRVALIAAMTLCVSPSKARSAEVDEVFHQGNIVLSGEGGFGHQSTRRIRGGINTFNLGARFSLLPFAPAGEGWYRGSLEAGLEPIFVHFTTKNRSYGGLALLLRYYLIDSYPLVPWIEGMAGAGGTDLRIPDLGGPFEFLLQAGTGVSGFVTPQIAPYVGFRFQHISNATLEDGDFGFNGYTGVVGLSYFF